VVGIQEGTGGHLRPRAQRRSRQGYRLIRAISNGKMVDFISVNL
jgi:hypothetical protein